MTHSNHVRKMTIASVVATMILMVSALAAHAGGPAPDDPGNSSQVGSDNVFASGPDSPFASNNINPVAVNGSVQVSVAVGFTQVARVPGVYIAKGWAQGRVIGTAATNIEYQRVGGAMFVTQISSCRNMSGYGNMVTTAPDVTLGGLLVVTSYTSRRWSEITPSCWIQTGHNYYSIRVGSGYMRNNVWRDFFYTAK